MTADDQRQATEDQHRMMQKAATSAETRLFWLLIVQFQVVSDSKGLKKPEWSARQRSLLRAGAHVAGESEAVAILSALCSRLLET